MLTSSQTLEYVAQPSKQDYSERSQEGQRFDESNRSADHAFPTRD